MKIYITRNDTDLQTLGTTLLRKSAASAAILAEVQRLNPQIEDFRRLPASTVLILPDSPDLKADTGTPLAGTNLGDLATELQNGVRATTDKAVKRFESLEQDHKQVTALLRTEHVKNLLRGEVAIQEQLETIGERFKEEKKHATETRARLAEVQKAAVAEFAKLQKLLEL